MQQNIAARAVAPLKLMMLIVMASCESQDRRLAEYAQRAAEQQARQNDRIAQQSEAVVKHSQEVTAAAHDLVEQDAAARRDLIQAQDKLQQQSQNERVSIDRQRQQLDAERKSAEHAAVRDPVIAQAIITGGLIVAALLPLLVTLYALRRLPEQRPVDELLGDTLLESLLTNASADPALDGPSLLDCTEQSLVGPTEPNTAGGDPPPT